MQRYVQSAMLDAGYAAGEPCFDGAAQIWLQAQLRDKDRKSKLDELTSLSEEYGGYDELK